MSKLFVKEWLDWLDVSQAELSRRTDLSPTTINRGINGTKNLMSVKNLRVISAALNVTIDDLFKPPPSTKSVDGMEALDRAKNNFTAPNSNQVAIPKFDLSTDMGKKSFITNSAAPTYLYVPNEFLELHSIPLKNIALISSQDKSMSPTIRLGDWVLIDTKANGVIEPGIYVIVLNDQILLKRCMIDFSSENIVLKSDNPAPEYADQNIPQGGSAKVLGRVIWRGVGL